MARVLKRLGPRLRSSVKSPSTGSPARLTSMKFDPKVTSESVSPGMSVVSVKPVSDPPLAKVRPVKSKPLKDVAV